MRSFSYAISLILTYHCRVQPDSVRLRRRYHRRRRRRRLSRCPFHRNSRRRFRRCRHP